MLWHAVCGMSPAVRWKATPVRFGSGIFGVYAPVLLAAVLIMTVAPGCVMPSCGFVRGGAVTTCQPPAPQHFKSACGLDTHHTPASTPCSSGDCGDTTMSHGTPDAVAAQSVDFPAPVAATLAQAPAVTPVVQLGHAATAVRLPDIPPPDPLGVRLIV